MSRVAERAWTGAGRPLPSPTQKGSQLVIISVPLYRIARVTLSPLVLGDLRQVSDVAIVAPFADHPGFQRDFGSSRTTFVTAVPPRVSKPQRALLSASEIMRRNGYWRRFRRPAMAYFVANELREFRADGDSTIGGFRKWIHRIVGSIGQLRKAWKLVDRLMGTAWAAMPQLETLAAGYESVTLIQSSNWGEQDRMLSTLSRARGWRRVMIPYTCDQLDVNGYLVNDFDAICIQGAHEERRALEFHRVPASRIVRLGSPWLRNLSRIRRIVEAEPTDGAITPYVMYAGGADMYMPRESELLAVDALALIAASRGLRFVYRPSGIWSNEARAALTRRYAGQAIEIQWPDHAAIGLGDYSEIDQEASLRYFVKNLLPCRLMVMSLTTSLAYDVAFLARCGIVANFADPSGVLAERQTALFQPEGYAGVSFTWNIEDMKAKATRLLDDLSAGRRQSEALLANWDYSVDGFSPVLRTAVLGSPL